MSLLPSPGDELGGRFLLKKLLGSGSSGAVYSATDTLVESEVTIKVFHTTIVDEKGMDRLRREVRISAEGSHPNIVKVHDLHTAEGLHFLSMELIEGKYLRDFIREDGKLPLDESLSVGRQIASVLEFLHERDIVHRDVKPGNIILMDDGTAKLCDLGLARRVEHGNTLTETNAVLGTPDYMAPEQARSRNLTSAIDIYALGITLYHALTGKVPLKEETTVATLMVRQKQTPPPLRKSLPGTPGWLNRLLVRMTHPVPGDRPTVAEVSKAVKLERFSIRISLKWVAVVILFSALITVLVIGYQSISHGDAVDYLVDGKSVQGLDSSGKVIWRATIPYSKVIYEKGDITGDGKPDIILYTKSGTLNIESHNNETLWVGAINSRGRFLTNMNLYPFLGSWEIPYEKQFKQTAFLLDLDDDGSDEIVMFVRQKFFYPSSILVYWPKDDVWTWLLRHSGVIERISTVKDASGKTLMVFRGINNRLGMMNVVGVIELSPIREERYVKQVSRSIIINGFPLDNHAAHTELKAYVPLGELNMGSRVFLDPKWTSLAEPCLRLEKGYVRLDRYFNPLPGPNAGVDLSQVRMKAMIAGYGLEKSLNVGDPDSTRVQLKAFRDEMAPLLNETAYRSILTLAGSRALASIGEPEDALSFLEKEENNPPSGDVLIEKATLLACLGRAKEAIGILRREVDIGRNYHTFYDVHILLMRVAMELREESLESRCVNGFMKKNWDLTGNVGGDDVSIACWSRIHLWWDNVTEVDCAAHSTEYTPAGDALACLAR